MLADLTGKTALVTGAGQGIGRGIAVALTQQGARVAVTDRRLEWAEATAAELGDRALALELDVTDQASVDTAAGAVLARWDKLDILVNNAGVPADPHRPTGRDREEDWDRTFAVNVKGVVRCCEAFVPSMRPRRYGKIVNIASMAAHAARRTAGPYAASKAALLRYTKGLAVSLAPAGINVNAICPGAVWTPFQQADTAALQRDTPSWPPSIRTKHSNARTATSSPSAGRKHPKTSARSPPSWHPTTRATSPASASTSTAAPSCATEGDDGCLGPGRQVGDGSHHPPNTTWRRTMTETWRGEKTGGMTPEEMNDFLKGPWLARLACLKPDGWPYLVPCWYHWDGVCFWVVPRVRSEWAFYMALDPRVCLLIDEPDPPIRKVICEGIAVIVEAAVGPYLENGEKSIWNQIGERYTGPRYLGTERAKEYRGSVNVEPCWTFKIVPRHITSWQGFAWAKRYKHTEFYPDQTGKANVEPAYPG